MTSLHLAVMPGRVWFDQLVADAKLLQRNLKVSFPVRTLCVEAIRKFRAVIRLNTLNRIRKPFFTIKQSEKR